MCAKKMSQGYVCYHVWPTREWVVHLLAPLQSILTWNGSGCTPGWLPLESASFLKNRCSTRETTCVWFGKAGHIFQQSILFLGKTISPIGKRGVHPCFCLPACCNCPWNLVSHYNLLIFKGNCDSSNSLLDFCCISYCAVSICSANVGCSPTPRQHFWKTAAPKNFSVHAMVTVEHGS